MKDIHQIIILFDKLGFTRTKLIIGLVAIIALVLLLFFIYRPVNSDPGYVIFDDNIIKVEIADEPLEMQLGLMFRESLPMDHGMLFIFEKDGIHSFWMMNVRFSLDMIWINSDYMVVHIERNVPPCLVGCPSYKSDVPARYVLEVNAGFVDTFSLTEGSSIKITNQLD
jgi:uncharacterized membrane protein (UPF0127 family)